MRALILTILLLTALPAAARDCGDGIARTFSGRGPVIRDAIDCLMDEIAALRRDQARMAARLRETEAALAAALAAVPADYVNEDGKVTAPEGRPLGRARFVLGARTTGGPSSLALDRAVVAALCGDTGGCALQLVRRELGLRAEPPQGTGPCLFLIDPETGGWVRTAGCGGTEARGIDGRGDAFTGGGGEIVAEAGGTCLLADAEARQGPGPDSALLTPDQGPGLYLIAAPGPGPARFRCELVIE